MKSEALKNALAMIAQPDATASSDDLILARDALDLPGTEAAIGQLEEQRREVLLTADDSAAESIDMAIRVARRDLDRRSAATAALDKLIAAAHEREAQDEIERHGEAAREAFLRATRAYVELDPTALKFHKLLRTIHEAEAELTHLNAHLRSVGRRDLAVEPPMDALARLAGVDGGYMHKVSQWRVEYMDPPRAFDGGAPPPGLAEARRFHHLAELLPDGGEPASAPAPKPKLKSVA